MNAPIKNLIIITINFITIILFFTCSKSKNNKNFSFSRPITIKIIDAESGIPIKGIIVFCELQEKELSNSSNNWLPLGGADYHCYFSHDKQISDDKGIVKFSKMNKKGKSFEEHENIYINLELNRKNKKIWKSIEKFYSDGHSLLDLDDLTNFNQKYFGYYITNYNHCFDNPNSWCCDPIEGVDVLVNGDSLNKKTEYIEVKLRRFSWHNSMGKKQVINCVK